MICCRSNQGRTQAVKRSLIAALLVLAALCPAYSAEPSAPEPTAGEQFSFVQMCDTQLGMGGYEHDVKTFTLAVEQINRMKPDFVVICGDLVGKANEQSWLDFNRIKSGVCHSVSLRGRESRCRKCPDGAVLEALP